MQTKPTGKELHSLTRISVAKAREKLSEAVSRVARRGDRIVLSRHGKDVAALVSVEDLGRLQALEDREDNAAADAALVEVERGAAIPWEDVKREAGLE